MARRVILVRILRALIVYMVCTEPPSFFFGVTKANSQHAIVVVVCPMSQVGLSLVRQVGTKASEPRRQRLAAGLESEEEVENRRILLLVVVFSTISSPADKQPSATTMSLVHHVSTHNTERAVQYRTNPQNQVASCFRWALHRVADRHPSLPKLSRTMTLLPLQRICRLDHSLQKEATAFQTMIIITIAS